MLSKLQRLNLKTNFRFVASGKSVTQKSFKIFYREGENEIPKIGVSIVSAQFKKATQRNKAKRIFFNLAKKYYNQLPKNINLVIMPRAQVLDLAPDDLEKQFNDAISNIKIN